MRRILALVLALVMTMALVACGGDKTTTSTPGTTTPGTTTPSTTTPSTTTPSTTTPSTTTPSTTEPSKPAEPAVDPDADKYGGDLKVVSSSAHTSFDPHQSDFGQVGNCTITMHIYEGIGILDANGKKYGQIFDIEESADGLTVKCTLRERYFSNGKRITMDDVMASLNRAVALLTDSTFDSYWGDVTVKVEGDVLTFSMTKYNLSFMSSICSDYTRYKIMPKEILDKYPVEGGTLQPNGFIKGGTAAKIDKIEDAIGSGPYVLTEFTDVDAKIARNDKYTRIDNKDAVGVAAPIKAYMDTIQFFYNSDASSRTAGLLVGDYHIGTVASDMVETALSMGIGVGNAGTTWTHGIFFNLDETNADSPVANVNVRKAMRAALDVRAILLSIVSGAEDRMPEELLPTPIAGENEVYKNTIFQDSEWNIADQELAKEYLKKANYDGTPIVYLTPPSGNFYKAAMATIPQWEAIGLKVELMVVDSGSHSAMRKDPTTGHDIGHWEVQKAIDNPVNQTTIVPCSWANWDSPERDRLVNIMKGTPTGSPESVQAYTDYCYLIAEECPYILYSHVLGRYGYQAYVVRNTVGQTNYYYWNTYFDKSKM